MAAFTRTNRAREAVAKTAPLKEARLAAGAALKPAPSSGQLAGPGRGNPLIADLRRAGLLPLIVLHYVSREPCYGNQLIDRIAALSAGAVAVNPNTMYPLLRSLEGRGLIAGAWEHPERRSRRFYRITPKGEGERQRLAEQLAPELDAVAMTIDVIRRELLDR
jgi:DNA-binding PadR family transcriptional regulator